MALILVTDGMGDADATAVRLGPAGQHRAMADRLKTGKPPVCPSVGEGAER
jgi:hypothetical protein